MDYQLVGGPVGEDILETQKRSEEGEDAEDSDGVDHEGSEAKEDFGQKGEELFPLLGLDSDVGCGSCLEAPQDGDDE